MTEKRLLKELNKSAIRQAFKELTPFSYTDGWFLSRELTPHISFIRGTQVSSRTVARYLDQMHTGGEVQKRQYQKRAGVHQWRLTV